MKFFDVADFLRKRGYCEYDIKKNTRVFYEYERLDFLHEECAKKFEVEYWNGEVKKIIMTQYWFGKTEFKNITTLDELYKSV